MEIDSFCGKACGKADADAQKTSENRAFLQTALLLVLPAHLLGLYAVGGKSFKKDFLARLKGHGRLRFSTGTSDGPGKTDQLTHLYLEDLGLGAVAGSIHRPSRCRVGSRCQGPARGRHRPPSVGIKL